MTDPIKYHVVVWDPAGEFLEGSIVPEQVARQLQARHVTTLPAHPQLFRLAGIGGYASRHWGAGWPLEGSVPRSICPITIYLAKGLANLQWVARLVPCDPALIDRLGEGKTIEGQIRMAGDSGQVIPNYPPVSQEEGPISMRKLLPQDAVDGGWIVGGRMTFSGNDGVYPFALYGVAPDLRVQWVAMSQSG